ncbi:MAG: Clp protease N-terminal domain-containing protein, partial [Nitrospirae bacterium]|nr:Clp protease N-terminal domain-containing protein [Nitrospirota bacterium]
MQWYFFLQATYRKRGRKVIIYAKEEAESRQNDYLGTEHLLLAVLRDKDGLPVTILRKMGVATEDLRMEVE